MTGVGVAIETAAGMYKRLEADREPYIRRAEECAYYTIPSLFPKEGSTSSTEFRTPYQAVGARGLNNLTAKILLAILPPNTPYFRLDMSEEERKKLQQTQGDTPEIMTAVEYKLSERERQIMKYHEQIQVRVTVGELIKQILVAGNAMLFLPPREGGIKLYKLNNYVLQRDGLGNTYNIVALDSLSFSSLSEEVQAIVQKSGERKPEDEVKIYTRTYLKGDEFISFQEVAGEEIPGSRQRYPKDKSPWIPIRMVKVDGESYGRGYVEEHFGDIKAFDDLSKAILEYAAIASRIIYLTNPNGQTRPSKLSKAKTGDFVIGRKDDVAALTLDKYNDFQVAKTTADGIESRLSYAFLLNSAVQRQAERVTAEEIRFVARELEDTLGGIYSILSQELQLPLVRCIIAQMERRGLLEPLPENSVEPQITTGIEALGRGHDLDKLDLFLKYLEGIPQAANYMKLQGLLKTVATAISLDISDLLKTDEEVQQAQQTAMIQEMLQRGSPQLAKGFADAQLQNNEGGS